MKRILGLIVLLALFVSLSQAQDVWGKGKMSVGAGAEVALPLGTWGDQSGLGIGGLGLFQYGFDDEIILTGQLGYTMWLEKEVYKFFKIEIFHRYGQLGYTMWLEKEVASTKYSSSALTILGGAKYDLSKKLSKGFYTSLQIGIYSLTQKAETPAINIGWVTIPAQTYESSSSELVILPGIGYQFGNFDINAKYTLKGNFGNICLNVLYVFPL